MGKKKDPEAKGTDVIRVDADLAYKLGVITAIRGGSVAEFASPLLRPTVEREYSAALREAAAKADRKPKPDAK